MSKTAILSAFLGLTVMLCGCSDAKKKKIVHSEIPVKTSIITSDEKEIVHEYIGIAEEDISVSLSFPVNGTVDRIYVREGQYVNKGTLLAELNTYHLVNSHSAAKAQLEQAEDAMRRLQMMYDNESLSEIKYIDTKTQLEKAKSMEAISRKNLEDSRMVAPYSGIIGKKKIETGENILPNQAVLTLSAIDEINIRVAVPEKEISKIRLNEPAMVTVGALNDKVFEGIITDKGIIADPIAHTYDIRIKVANTDRQLLPGMVAKVRINDAQDKEIIYAPSNSIQIAANGEKFVWKVKDNQVAKQKVHTAGFLGGGVEITSGLHAGDEIITEGYQHVFEGMKINARQQ